MISEFGAYALILALVLAVLQTVLAAAGRFGSFRGVPNRVAGHAGHGVHKIIA